MNHLEDFHPFVIINFHIFELRNQFESIFGYDNHINAIHVRLSKSDSEALLHSQAKGDPVYCREVEAGILRKVHGQIKLQLPTVGDAFLTDAIKAMVEEKKTYIDAIRKLIKDEENDRYAH